MAPWKRRRFMNVGPLDKRRIVRRCEQCRISRTKCEGGRPCHACRARLTRCQDQTHHGATRLEITLPEMPIVLVNPAESQLLSTTASLDNVYKFVGTLPSPVTDLFSTDMLPRLFQEDESIRAALVQIGNAYVNNGGQQVQSRKGSMLMKIKQRELYTMIQTRLQKPNSHLDPSLLLLAVLFCLLEVLPQGTKIL
ncbi:uncharacterized protein FTOL_07854 [Fusarium torulosum]|uniref:Zn(2)-C6 fungal-type domain-containing protein n=1 Tax=Fusarium torulosum TaxID=33205 RepID=A0AAE8SJD9_9HYPO|nr:uncharacterized protein FTOL_07854 [Fusarium torulosum]